MLKSQDIIHFYYGEAFRVRELSLVTHNAKKRIEEILGHKILVEHHILPKFKCCVGFKITLPSHGQYIAPEECEDRESFEKELETRYQWITKDCL